MPLTQVQGGMILPSTTLTTPIVATTLGVGGATAAASGAGITFPATQSASSDANTLDDYEEGSWTATVAAGGIPYQNCRYTKIGRAVTVTGQINFSGATVSADIGGLTFTAAATHDVGVAILANGMEVSTGGPVQGIVLNNSNQILFYSWVNNSLGSAYQSSGNINIMVTYFV
jgi:hypothetical protein